MSETMFQVTVENKTGTFPAGTAYGEILAELVPEKLSDTMLILANGTLRELHKPLLYDCEIKCVMRNSEIGRETYKRSLNYLFLKALRDVTGKDIAVQAVLCFANSNGLYYTVKGRKADSALADAVRARMKELVSANLPIEKEKVKTTYAAKMFEEQGMTDKRDLFRFRRGSLVNTYRLEEYYDYCYGFMVWNTGYLSWFDVSVYEDGLVLVLPDASDGKTMRPFMPYPKVFRVQQLSEKWGDRQGINTVADLNHAVSVQQFSQQMLVTEALQEGRIAEIAADIQKRGNVKFVMIAGPSSSGKTTFSRRLSIQLMARGLTPHPLSLDNFYRDRADCPRDENGELDFECLEALDVDLIMQTLADLQQGKRVEIPYFNFLTGSPEYKGDFLQLHDEDIMVIEGIHGLNPKLSEKLPEESVYRIYISALTTLNIDAHNYIPTTDARLLRRIVRDYYHRGTSACETIERWASVRNGEEKYIFTNQENADEMFNSSLLYELSIMKVYAEPLLYQVPTDKPAYLEANRLLKFLDYFLGHPSEDVPKNSILREFIGGSCFDV